jgi:hypothetical protein
MEIGGEIQCAGEAWRYPGGRRWVVLWRATVAATLVGATVWGLLDVRRRGAHYPQNPGRHSSDFTVYTVASRALLEGRDPYAVTNVRGWYYLYPPLFALVVSPLSFLRPRDQVTVWFFASVLMAWGCLSESRRAAGALVAAGELPRRTYAWWFPPLAGAAVVAVICPTANCLQRGQVGIAKLFLMLLGLRLILQDGRAWRTALGGALLALPVVIKLTPALPVGFLLLVILAAAVRRGPGRRRAAGRLAAAGGGLGLGLALFLFVIPAAAVGWGRNLRHLGVWYAQTRQEAVAVSNREQFGYVHSVRNQELNNAAYRMGNWLAHTFAGAPDDRLTGPEGPELPMDAPLARQVTLGVRAALLAALLAAGVRLGLRNGPLTLAAAFGLASTALLVLEPLSRRHYFILLAPGTLFVPLWLVMQGRRRAAAVLAVVPAALTIAYYVSYHGVGRLGLLGLGTAAWLVAAMVLLWRRPLLTTGREPK